MARVMAATARIARRFGPDFDDQRHLLPRTEAICSRIAGSDAANDVARLRRAGEVLRRAPAGRARRDLRRSPPWRETCGRGCRRSCPPPPPRAAWSRHGSRARRRRAPPHRGCALAAHVGRAAVAGKRSQRHDRALENERSFSMPLSSRRKCDACRASHSSCPDRNVPVHDLDLRAMAGEGGRRTPAAAPAVQTRAGAAGLGEVGRGCGRSAPRRPTAGRKAQT